MLFKFFKTKPCHFTKRLHNIHLENNTAVLIYQCRCGKTETKHTHRDSEEYNKFILLVK